MGFHVVAYGADHTGAQAQIVSATLNGGDAVYVTANPFVTLFHPNQSQVQFGLLLPLENEELLKGWIALFVAEQSDQIAFQALTVIKAPAASVRLILYGDFAAMQVRLGF